jgi:hypothetical protein
MQHSCNPLFDFASTNDVRDMKHLVEKRIGSEFDYRICQNLYLQMKGDDEEPQSSPSITQPSFDPLPPDRSGLFDRIRGHLSRRDAFAHRTYIIPIMGQGCDGANGRRPGPSRTGPIGL